MSDVICGLDHQRKSMHAVFAVAMDHHVPSQFINGTWKQCHFVRLLVAVVSFQTNVTFLFSLQFFHVWEIRNISKHQLSIVEQIFIYSKLRKSHEQWTCFIAFNRINCWQWNSYSLIRLSLKLNRISIYYHRRNSNLPFIFYSPGGTIR